MTVLNLIITGIPSIQNNIKCVTCTPVVLNLIITGIPSIRIAKDLLKNYS